MASENLKTIRAVDDGWEDVDERPNHRSSSRTSTRASSSHGTPKTRRVVKRRVPKATPAPAPAPAVPASPRKLAPPVPPSPSPPPPPTKSAPSPPPRKYIETQEVLDGAFDGASFTFKYLFDVFSTAVHLLRRPLYLVAFLWLLALIISYISSTLRGAFAPLCYLPGLYSSRLCTVPSSGLTRKKKLSQWADYPRLVDVQSTTFEHLLDEAVGGSGLSLEIKKAEMATSDLVTLVRASDLKSKDMLGNALVDFVQDARKTGKDLQKLNSKIGGAVDNIMAVNDYALHQIEAAHARKPTIGTLYGLIPSRKPSTKEIVVQTFDEAMSVLSGSMERLILEAEVNLNNLGNLEERLATLHELIHREDNSVKSDKQDVLSELWTKLGGNRRQLRNFERHLEMLNNLGLYRKKALAHVVAALQSLQAMSGDMDDLRERVAAPELTGSKIPVEVHMKSIKGGLERLKEGRVRARKLEEDVIHRVLGIGTGLEIDEE